MNQNNLELRVKQNKNNLFWNQINKYHNKILNKFCKKGLCLKKQSSLNIYKKLVIIKLLMIKLRMVIKYKLLVIMIVILNLMLLQINLKLIAVEYSEYLLILFIVIPCLQFIFICLEIYIHKLKFFQSFFQSLLLCTI